MIIDWPLIPPKVLWGKCYSTISWLLWVSLQNLPSFVLIPCHPLDVCFHLGAFRVFSLLLVFSSLTMTCLTVVFLVFLLPGFCWACWNCGVISVISFGKISAITSSDFNSVPFSLSSYFGTLFTHLLVFFNFVLCPHLPYILSRFFSHSFSVHSHSLWLLLQLCLSCHSPYLFSKCHFFVLLLRYCHLMCETNVF